MKSLTTLFTKIAILMLIACSAHGDDDAAATPVHPDMGPYEVRLERSYFVPMRDGVRLSMDLYLPVNAGTKMGTILEHTPYNKNSAQFRAEPWSRARFFASHGFVFAVQDKRGKFESEGQYLTTVNDVEDTDDALNWIAAQPWSNGKVGMIGCSYPGANTIKAAQTLNPHLSAIIPQSAAMATGSVGDRYSLFWRRGGVVNISVAAWAAVAGSTVFYRPPPGLSREEFLEIVDFFDPAPKYYGFDAFADPATLKKFNDAYLTLPITEIANVLKAPPNDWALLASLEIDDPWWKQQGYLMADSQVDVPALHINGWRDYGVADTLVQFNFFRSKALSRTSRENQYAIISPTSHCVSETVSEHTLIGDLDVGDARFDYWGTYLRWYDRWLNDNKKALDSMPHVQYYNVGANEWRSAEEWPVPGTQYREFFLASDGRANSHHGDGRMQKTVPPSGAAADTYVYDPGVPNTTLSALRGRDEDVWNGAFDRRELETRNDVLVYTSEQLTEALDVTGPMKAVLYVSSTAKDTDFDLTLVDVFPDGRAMGVYEGVLRARYREGFDRKVFMQAGEVYEIVVDMNVTSNTFLPGHQIRLEIASSRFPNHDRNLNTGGDNYNETEWLEATNTIHHSAQYPSRLVLPVVPH
ncbi:MAG: CocE/NonD family hydrolase [Xanthomonadales bacterium]|nr:CocE/NonD family hydrolase [Xanthomonadales bacterium]